MKINLYALLCWFFVIMFALMQFDLQLIQSFFVNDLSSFFHLDNIGVAKLSSSFFYAFLAMQIPAGIIFTKHKTRNVLFYAIIISGIGCLVFGDAHSLYIAYLGRILIGAGCAFAYIGLIVVINDLFDSKYFILFVGISEFLSITGAGFLENLFAYMIANLGWRETCILVAIMMLILGMLIYVSFLLLDMNRQNNQISPKGQNKDNLLLQVWNVITNKVIILSCIYGFAIYSICSGFASLWAIPLLKINYPFIYNSSNPGMESAKVAQMILIGIGFGSIVIGWLSAKIKPVNIMIFCSSGIFILSIVFLCTHVGYEYNLMILFFIIGVMASSYILSYTISKEYAEIGQEAIAIAVTNMIIVSGTIILQPIIGWLLDLHSSWSNHILGPLTTNDFYFALWVLPISFFIAIISAFYLKRLVKTAL